MTTTPTKSRSYSFLIIVLIGAALCLPAQKFIPFWWIFAPLMFLIQIIAKHRSFARSFFAGFLSTFMAWMSAYLFFNIQNNGILSSKMADLFMLSSGITLFLVASILMGIIGGLASGSAYFLFKK